MLNLNKCKVIDKDISENHLHQVYELHKIKLGDGYLNFEHFKKLASNNHLLIAILNNEVLGYLTIDITTEKEFFKQKRVDITANNDPVLILNTCASKYENVELVQN